MKALHNFTWYLMRLPKRIKRGITYFRIGMKQEDWDYSYLLDLLDFKLERMYECMKDGHVDIDYSGIKTALTFLREWGSDSGEMTEWQQLNLKYGIERSVKEVKIKGHTFYKPEIKSTTGLNMDDYNKEFLELTEKWRKKRVHAKNEFFRVLRTRIEYWWD